LPPLRYGKSAAELGHWTSESKVMTSGEKVIGFSNVDQTSDPQSFMRYLETASANESIQARKRRTFELLAVQAGHRLLDVGCGLGDDVRALAQLVGPTGQVIGIDNSEAMIAEARKRGEGVNLPVEYRIGDAHQLVFPANSFDGCRAERIFMHLESPRQALAEIVRVARPGARIVALDPDFGTLVVDAEEQAVTQRILSFHPTLVRNGWIGRQLPRLFREANLAEVAVFADTLVVTDYALAEQGWRLRETAERAQTAGAVSIKQR
jgi:ubiquinone/menaquinone biosynthesis C-methylase UbiE